jgi:hypothetical protein
MRIEEMDEKALLSSPRTSQELDGGINRHSGPWIIQGTVGMITGLEAKLRKKEGPRCHPVDLVTRPGEQIREVGHGPLGLASKGSTVERWREAGEHGHVGEEGPGGGAHRSLEGYPVFSESVDMRRRLFLVAIRSRGRAGGSPPISRLDSISVCFRFCCS